MRKWCLVFLMSFLAITPTFGQNDEQFFFKIDGAINADTGSVKLNFLTDYVPNDVKSSVSKVKNGKFSFSGYLPEPQSVYICLDDHYPTSEFIIEKGLQTISINRDSTRKVPVVSNNTMVNEYPIFASFFKQHDIKSNICH